ncbi:18977_t:CDS:2, partial [Racocetra fulgida]
MASQYIKGIVAGGITLGFGYLLMKVVTPTKEQLYEDLKFELIYLTNLLFYYDLRIKKKLSPDLKHQIGSREQRENNVAIMDLMKKVAESDKPRGGGIIAGIDVPTDDIIISL